ncbi:DUF6283 family protein [Amycolatopsis sp. cmx-4-68]|uniref:DUF6283 family protein n=1 Tax=Amycolatopsis sp. cmx-4-68 TaxID=2790938 RepID=UPI00397CB616
MLPPRANYTRFAPSEGNPRVTVPDPSENAPAARGAEVVAVREGADGWGVVTISSPGGAYQVEPCLRCPWLLDSPVGAFPPEVFRLSAHTTYDQAKRRFGCHASKPDEPKTCAGFLLRGAAHNLTVRMYGPDITSDVSSDRPLYANYREMAIANGVAPDDPILAPCRDARPYLDEDATTSAADLARDRAAATVARAVRIIRDFIVESAGMDLGEPMTADATLLAGRLAAAGHLTAPPHEKYSGNESAVEFIRAFIVECVGSDTGAEMTHQAEQMRQRIAAAGLLAGGVHEPVPMKAGPGQ